MTRLCRAPPAMQRREDGRSGTGCERRARCRSLPSGRSRRTCGSRRGGLDENGSLRTFAVVENAPQPHGAGARLVHGGGATDRRGRAAASDRQHCTKPEGEGASRRPGVPERNQRTPVPATIAGEQESPDRPAEAESGDEKEADQGRRDQRAHRVRRVDEPDRLRPVVARGSHRPRHEGQDGPEAHHRGDDRERGEAQERRRRCPGVEPVDGRQLGEPRRDESMRPIRAAARSAPRTARRPARRAASVTWRPARYTRPEPPTMPMSTRARTIPNEWVLVPASGVSQRVQRTSRPSAAAPVHTARAAIGRTGRVAGPRRPDASASGGAWAVSSLR